MLYNNITVIDDTYNANLESCTAAIDYLMAFSGTGRKILVLGDMLELGEASNEQHIELGIKCSKVKIDAVFTLGRETKATHSNANDVNINLHFKESKELTKERGHLEGLSDQDIDSLCSKIGKAGLKYFLLKVDPKKKMAFNPKESIDLNGHTGPFIQYGYARIKSLLKRSSSFDDFDLNAFPGNRKAWQKFFIEKNIVSSIALPSGQAVYIKE